MNPATRVRRQKLTLANGVPVRIALEYTSGQRRRSRIPGAPDQMYYSLTGEREAYFPLEVGRMIDELHLDPREPFTICKYGPREWDIQRVAPDARRQTPDADPELPPFAPIPPPLPPAIARRDEGIRHVPAAAPSPTNGAGEDLEAILMRSYASAIMVTKAALEAARAEGLHFAPTHDALQACAATLFIAETRRNS